MPRFIASIVASLWTLIRFECVTFAAKMKWIRIDKNALVDSGQENHACVASAWKLGIGFANIRLFKHNEHRES